jgi:hypothetical protein
MLIAFNSYPSLISAMNDLVGTACATAWVAQRMSANAIKNDFVESFRDVRPCAGIRTMSKTVRAATIVTYRDTGLGPEIPQRSSGFREKTHRPRWMVSHSAAIERHA